MSFFFHLGVFKQNICLLVVSSNINKFFSQYPFSIVLRTCRGLCQFIVSGGHCPRSQLVAVTPVPDLLDKIVYVRLFLAGCILPFVTCPCCASHLLVRFLCVLLIFFGLFFLLLVAACFLLSDFSFVFRFGCVCWCGWLLVLVL